MRAFLWNTTRRCFEYLQRVAWCELTTETLTCNLIANPACLKVHTATGACLLQTGALILAHKVCPRPRRLKNLGACDRETLPHGLPAPQQRRVQTSLAGSLFSCRRIANFQALRFFGSPNRTCGASFSNPGVI